MKATLEFDLPEERHEFLQSARAGDYYCALWDFGNELRSISKHGREGFDEETVDKIRQIFFDATEGLLDD